ncbi:uncharacterized protein LOC106407957 [Brassica napus]|uniref:uncharacterized protein LOC106407957 n=1 Tax=Brassica napus TaxID=3708 RepID=UPI0006AB5BE4|nr:uncharacterized protein LOC106407957 [Brassica napus]
MRETEKNMSGWRKICIALVIKVDGVLIGHKQEPHPTPRYVKMVEDLRLKQHTFRLQGFPLSLQLVAFHAIPQILSYIPAPIDQKTIMDLEDDYLPQHPSISSRDIRRVEFDPDHVVTPIIPIESQTQLGWGVWPNDPKVDSVIYMEQLIADHHSFNKEVWPGGVTSEPLIVKPKQRVKKKVSASIKQSLKPRQVKKKHPSIRKQRRISSYFTHATKTTFTNEQLTEIVIKLQSNMKNLKQLIKRIKKKSHGRQTPFHERLSRRKKTATPQQTDQPGPELHDAPIDQDDHTMETDDLPESTVNALTATASPNSPHGRPSPIVADKEQQADDGVVDLTKINDLQKHVPLMEENHLSEELLRCSTIPATAHRLATPTDAMGPF